MKWNLRLAAANRGIWKASELQRLLAERGMVISAGKMSGLWSGQPNTVRLDELDVICAVLGCEVGELLLPEPEAVPRARSQRRAAGRCRGGSRCHAPVRGPAGRCRPGDRAHCRNDARQPAGPRLLHNSAARWRRLPAHERST